MMLVVVCNQAPQETETMRGRGRRGVVGLSEAVSASS